MLFHRTPAFLQKSRGGNKPQSLEQRAPDLIAAIDALGLRLMPARANDIARQVGLGCIGGGIGGGIGGYADAGNDCADSHGVEEQLNRSGSWPGIQEDASLRIRAHNSARLFSAPPGLRGGPTRIARPTQCMRQ
jgi:hypothetical protein